MNEVYRRVGGAFKGTMEQNFVALTDKRRSPVPAAQSGPSGLSKQRPIDGQQLVFNQRRELRVERSKRGEGKKEEAEEHSCSMEGERLEAVATQPQKTKVKKQKRVLKSKIKFQLVS